MHRVDQVIAMRLESSVALVGGVSQYIIGAGGKRLRPALLLLVCGALGYQDAQKFNMAAVVEFIHTATLLHDDVVDESALRRGRATANSAFGACTLCDPPMPLDCAKRAAFHSFVAKLR